MSEQTRLTPRNLGRSRQRARFSPASRALFRISTALWNETFAGVVLFTSSLVALVWANSPWSQEYFYMREARIAVDLYIVVIDHSIRHWVNDGLMVIFFFLVGLEVKAELARGELSHWKQAALPAGAAIGGMLFPAAIYALFNHGTERLSGWAIPMATDIVFALGVLSLLKAYIPPQLRLFLLALATADDIGVILVIAIFYASEISVGYLGIAAALVAAILMLKYFKVRNVSLFVLLGIILWHSVLQSGVHPTIAGVLLGLLVRSFPTIDLSIFTREAGSLLDRMRSQDQTTALGAQRIEHDAGRLQELVEQSESPLDQGQRILFPWVYYFILPLFALVNAGVDLSYAELKNALHEPVTHGIFFGFSLGKPLGTILGAYLLIKLGWAALPSGVTMRHLLGAGMLAGIGFTVSLFITNLAIQNADLNEMAKIGILSGSVVSAICGCAVLVFHPANSEPSRT